MSVIVIGGGAAGCLAAILLARGGESVTLLEKNARIGRKIYITGKGRCNLTADYPPQEFLGKVVRGEKFLRSAVYGFSPEDTKEFFNAAGVELITERGGRVFPATQKSTTVIDALSREMDLAGVNFVAGAEVLSATVDEGGFSVKTADGREYVSDRLVVATGGKSYPSTGSTGDGYRFAEGFGHTVVKPVPSLAQLITVEDVVALKGLSLKNVTLSAYAPDGKRLASEFGEMLFTDKGLSGPVALSVSARVNRASGVKLSLDLKPALSREKLDARVLRDFSERPNADIQNAMRALLPARLDALKGLSFTLLSVAPFEEAVVTSGGVTLAELTPACGSRLCDGLYFAGEVIDADALTGGYNMQIAFSTAAAVARDILKKEGR